MENVPALARTWSTRAAWITQHAVASCEFVETALMALECGRYATVFTRAELPTVRSFVEKNSGHIRTRETSLTDRGCDGTTLSVLQEDVALYADRNDLDLCFLVSNVALPNELTKTTPTQSSLNTFVSGLASAPIRIEKQGQNARHVARLLAGHPRVARVAYAGLRTDPEYPRTQEQAHLPDSLRLVLRDASLHQPFAKALTLFCASPSRPSISSWQLGESDCTLRCGLEDPSELAADILRTLAECGNNAEKR